MMQRSRVRIAAFLALFLLPSAGLLLSGCGGALDNSAEQVDVDFEKVQQEQDAMRSAMEKAHQKGQ